MTGNRMTKGSEARMRGWICILLMLSVIFVFAASPASADMGPKPSVTVEFDGRGDETLYATLLSDEEIYGPWRTVSDDVLTELISKAETEEEAAAWQAIYDCAVTDPEGFRMMDQMFTVGPDEPLAWTYYPPEEFKVAVYVPSEGTVYVSDEMERDAFESYFSAQIPDASGSPSAGAAQPLFVTEDIRMGSVIGAFALRMVLTVVIEVLLALLFKYRKKKEIITIIVVNIITQGLLNLIMGLFDYTMGGLVWVFVFPILEILVFVIELIVYLIAFKDHSKGKTFGYTLLANFITMALGLAVAVFFMAV